MIEILLVDDNVGDVRLLQEVFNHTKLRNHITAVEDGTEAMAFLRHEGRHITAPRPRLIILDLNMPRLDGREVLRIIKADTNFKLIPAIVFTASMNPQDLVDCYTLHANAYVTKPSQMDEFMDVVEKLSNFWLHIAKLPPIK